jgi:hypothetical protein
VDSAVVIPLVTLILGFGLSFVAETYRKRTERRYQLQDGLRQERARAYQAFLVASQQVATRLGECSAGYTHRTATAEDIEGAKLDVDRVFVPTFRHLEILASEGVLEHAYAMWQVLELMRDEVVAKQLTHYLSDEYMAVYRPYMDARSEFIRAARADVVPASR